MAKTRSGQERLREAIEYELHELCQPLTTLRCRLELALMLCEPGDAESQQALREAVMEGLDDMRRAFVSVERLRECLLSRGPMPI